jgi:hypothetical protein
MLSHQGHDSVEFILGESAVVFQSDWLKPDLGRLLIPRDVHVVRLVTITGKEEETIRAASQDGRTHWVDSASFPGSGTLFLRSNAGLQPRQHHTTSHAAVGWKC